MACGYKWQGERMTAPRWARRLGISTCEFLERVRDYGWPGCMMRNYPASRTVPQPYTYKGKTQSLAAWARELGIKQSSMVQRKNYWGWPQCMERKYVMGGHKPTYTYKGRTLTMAEWARVLKVKRRHLQSRKELLGWPKCVEGIREKLPPKPRRGKEITYNGLTRTRTAWAKHFGLNMCTFRWRIAHWGLKEAMRYSATRQPGQLRIQGKVIMHNGVTRTRKEWAAEFGIPYNTLATNISRRGVDGAMSWLEARKQTT